MARAKFDVVDEYVRTACGDLEILGRKTLIQNLGSLVSRLGKKYKAPLVATKYEEATTEECARAAASNIEMLIAEASYIRGLTAANAQIIDGHLVTLIALAKNFTLTQDAGKWDARLRDAIAALLASPLVQPGYAGSALKPRGS